MRMRWREISLDPGSGANRQQNRGWKKFKKAYPYITKLIPNFSSVPHPGHQKGFTGFHEQEQGLLHPHPLRRSWTHRHLACMRHRPWAKG